MTQPFNEYEHNLVEFRRLLDSYTIADLKRMVYDIPVSASGACCYPAVQSLIALLETLGVLLEGRRDGDAFISAFRRLGGKYDDKKLAGKIYDAFRHGIAHSTLARADVLIKKDGRSYSGFEHPEGLIDVKIFLEDFLPVYEKVFSETLMSPNVRSYYERRLRKVFKSLKLPWLTGPEQDLIKEKKAIAGWK